MSAGRFVIEGLWLGYRSHQDRVVHRTVHAGSEKTLRAWVEKTYGIRYSDGTTLQLSVRDAKPRERVKTINGYSKLIRDCMLFDVSSVDALCAAEAAAKAARSAA